jgi:hypothetical protein
LDPQLDLVDEARNVRSRGGEVSYVFIVEISRHERHVKCETNCCDRWRDIVVKVTRKAHTLTLDRDSSDLLKQNVVVDCQTHWLDGARDGCYLLIVEIDRSIPKFQMSDLLTRTRDREVSSGWVMWRRTPPSKHNVLTGDDSARQVLDYEADIANAVLCRGHSVDIGRLGNLDQIGE